MYLNGLMILFHRKDINFSLLIKGRKMMTKIMEKKMEKLIMMDSKSLLKGRKWMIIMKIIMEILLGEEIIMIIMLAHHGIIIITRKTITLGGIPIMTTIIQIVVGIPMEITKKIIVIIMIIGAQIAIVIQITMMVVGAPIAMIITTVDGAPIAMIIITVVGAPIAMIIITVVGAQMIK